MGRLYKQRIHPSSAFYATQGWARTELSFPPATHPTPTPRRWNLKLGSASAIGGNGPSVPLYSLGPATWRPLCLEPWKQAGRRQRLWTRATSGRGWECKWPLSPLSQRLCVAEGSTELKTWQKVTGKWGNVPSCYPPLCSFGQSTHGSVWFVAAGFLSSYVEVCVGLKSGSAGPDPPLAHSWL